MVFRCILAKWAEQEFPNRRRVLEGTFSDSQIQKLNSEYYNIYFLPNYPSDYQKGSTVDGSQIDVFRFVFVDFDLKSGTYPSKISFYAQLMVSGIEPTFVVDSGNGVHAYWQVNDLDAMSYLRLQRRLMRHFRTDEAVGQIYQLMRVPGTLNTKTKDDFKPCVYMIETEKVYTCEDLDNCLSPITLEDEEYCKLHFNKTYNVDSNNLTVDEKIPPKFGDLLRSNKEAKEIWAGDTDDRSKGDYRLGHVMFGNGFTKEEATSVLVNSAKALSRAPVHRISYAHNIVDKIWTYELSQDKQELSLSSTVKEILQKHGDAIKGDRLPCWRYLDDTLHGFRLGQVIGLVAGAKVGKTAMALNMFMGFVQNNPDYEHFFIPLEQPANEIADRWKTMCGDKTYLYDKVHVISNYYDGGYRNLSIDEIKDYIIKFQKTTNKKVGCVVVDHIGVLKREGKSAREHVENVSAKMKAAAIETNTLLVMQSQAPREKAGIGDLELNKDAAYGSVLFESFVDYLISIWQPLKRCYSEEGCPTVTAYKFPAIRHKKHGKDVIQEDVCYRVFFDPNTECMREMTQNEEISFDYFQNKCVNKRKRDNKTELVVYTSIKWNEQEIA